MPSFSNHGSDIPVTTGETRAAGAIVENTPSNNKELFVKIADLVSPEMMKDTGIRRGITEQALESRVVDLPVPSNVMKTAKLNLTSNGALLISLNDGKQLFNHPVTNAERGKLNNIVNNPNLSEDNKMERLQTLVTSISMSTMLSNNFEKNYQHSQSISSSMQR